MQRHLYKRVMGKSLTKFLATATLMVAGLGTAFADGTRDMYPANYSTLYPSSDAGYRAPMLSLGIGSEGNSTYSTVPFPTPGTVRVYAKEGEKIYVASSLFTSGRTSSKIVYYAPDGMTSGTFTKSGKIGLIENRTQELAGPQLNGVPSNGYQACVIEVGPGQEGVWEINFDAGITSSWSASTGGITVDDWSGLDGSNNPCVCAFDVSVLMLRVINLYLVVRI